MLNWLVYISHWHFFLHSCIISVCIISWYRYMLFKCLVNTDHSKYYRALLVYLRFSSILACVVLVFSSVPHLTVIHHSKLEITMLDRFGVSFGTEGGSISLVCTMVVVPDLPNVPPLAQWYRDGEWVNITQWYIITNSTTQESHTVHCVKKHSAS